MKDIAIENNSIKIYNSVTFENIVDTFNHIKALILAQRSVVLDFSELSRADSTVVALIMQCWKICADEKIDFHVINVPYKVVKLLKVSGLDDVLEDSLR